MHNMGLTDKRYVSNLRENHRTRQLQRHEPTVNRIKPPSRFKTGRKPAFDIPELPSYVLKPIKRVSIEDYKENFASRPDAQKLSDLIRAGHKAKREVALRATSRTRGERAVRRSTDAYRTIHPTQTTIEADGVTDSIQQFTQNSPSGHVSEGFMARHMTRNALPNAMLRPQRLPFTNQPRPGTIANRRPLIDQPRQEGLTYAPNVDHEGPALRPEQSRSVSVCEPAIDIPALAAPKAVSYAEARRRRQDQEEETRRAGGRAVSGRVGYLQHRETLRSGSGSARERQRLPLTIRSQESTEASAIELQGLSADQADNHRPSHPNLPIASQGTVNKMLENMEEDAVMELEQWMEDAERQQSRHRRSESGNRPAEDSHTPYVEDNDNEEFPCVPSGRSGEQCRQRNNTGQGEVIDKVLAILDDPSFDPTAVSGIDLCETLMKNASTMLPFPVPPQQLNDGSETRGNILTERPRRTGDKRKAKRDEMKRRTKQRKQEHDDFHVRGRDSLHFLRQEVEEDDQCIEQQEPTSSQVRRRKEFGLDGETDTGALELGPRSPDQQLMDVRPGGRVVTVLPGLTQRGECRPAAQATRFIKGADPLKACRPLS